MALLIPRQYGLPIGEPFDATVLGEPESLSVLVPGLRSEVERSVPPLDLTLPVGFMGIGASRAACGAAHWELLTAGIWSQRFTGEEMIAPLGVNGYFVAVSLSGRSPEPLNAARQARGAPLITVTNDVDGPLAKWGAPALVLGGVRDSGVSTIGYCLSAVLVSMVAEVWTLGSVNRGWESLGEHLATVIERNNGVLDSWSRSFATTRSVDVVAQGPWLGCAEAIALAIREALHVPAAAFDTRSYLHGQVDSIDETTGQILLGGERERILHREIRDHSGIAVCLTHDTDVTAGSLDEVAVPGIGSGQYTAVAAAFLHELLRRWARRIGVRPDDASFTRLDTKSPE